MSNCLGFFQIIHIILSMVKSRLKTDQVKFYMGYFWWIIEPALSLFVYYVFIGLLLKRGGVKYIESLLFSLILWKALAVSIRSSSLILIKKHKLLNQVYLPKYIFPIVQVITSGAKYLIILSALLIASFFFGMTYTINILWLPFVLFVFATLAIGASLLVSAITPFIPDFKHVVPQLLQVSFYGSGVIFNASMIPEKYIPLLKFNPLFNCFEAYKSVIVFGRPPDFKTLLVSLAIGVGLGLIGFFMLFKYDKEYPKLLR